MIPLMCDPVMGEATTVHAARSTAAAEQAALILQTYMSDIHKGRRMNGREENVRMSVVQRGSELWTVERQSVFTLFDGKALFSPNNVVRDAVPRSAKSSGHQQRHSRC